MFAQLTALLGIVLMLTLTACKVEEEHGPGMTVSYGTLNRKQDVRYSPAEEWLSQTRTKPLSVTDNGTTWPWTPPGRYGVGVTEGGAPDPRGLPEWIEFKWREIPISWDFPSFEEWQKQLATLPVKSYRVYVKHRIPQDVVDAVMASKRRRKEGQLEDRGIWVYFMWQGSEIRFHWELHDQSPGRPAVLREGGDPMPADWRE